jgi:hypothetical protein
MNTTTVKNVSLLEDGPTQVTPAKSFDIEAAVKLSENFAQARRTGSVVGGPLPQGGLRKGVDRERVIGIDNGALRIKPLINPGWGRAGIAYGPFERRNGRTFAVFMVNCHNTSQSENLKESFRDRFDRWLRGPDLHSRSRRMLQWLLSKRRGRMIRQWLWWHRISVKSAAVPRIDENLAIGWFPTEVPADPLAEGNGLAMHATGAENGELWARVGNMMLPTIRGVQNLQIHYVVVLRERGAAYYACSVPGANGLGAYPNLRLLAIDAFNEGASLYAGVYQSTLGQIGFRLDTRIYGTRVVDVPEWGTWYGTAHAADHLDGSGALEGSAAEVGGVWQQKAGGFERTADGAEAIDDCNVALLHPTEPSGLIHVVIHVGSNDARSAGLVWRYLDAENFWQLTVGPNGCELALHQAGQSSTVARSDSARLKPNSSQAMQVVDEGHRFSLFLDGELLFDSRFADTRLWRAAGVGIVVSGKHSGVRMTRFEAHPLECRLPISLDQGSPWWRLGQRDVITDSFDGPARDLDGKATTTGGQTWRRIIGSGHIDVTGNGSAKFRANPAQRSPGRLAYTVDWSHPQFADLEVEITPPGTGPGQGEHGLCGFILWQDPKNYVMLNIWRHQVYDGASISTFFLLDGFEDLYDAIWANVGTRVHWGRAHRLRITFDGMRYMAFVDDEPVLFRALTDVYPDARPLEIRRVGLLGNWEWGTDTGSVLRSFRARV